MAWRLCGAAALLAGLAGCGGGGSALGNAPDVQNPPVQGGQKLSFIYFQKCVDPVFVAQLQAVSGGGTNTCAASGCHDSVTGTGGALRVIPSAQAVDMTDPANTPDAVRQTDMYKNYYSAQGEVVVGVPHQSRIVQKPLLMNVLHGGGQIFASEQDPNVQRFEYWITHPVPTGQDEFSIAANQMFTPPDPNTGSCNTQ
jgi:hypothetical protein